MMELGFVFGIFCGCTLIGVGGFLLGHLAGSRMTASDRQDLNEYRNQTIRASLSETTRYIQLGQAQTLADCKAISRGQMRFDEDDVCNECQDELDDDICAACQAELDGDTDDGLTLSVEDYNGG